MIRTAQKAVATAAAAVALLGSASAQSALAWGNPQPAPATLVSPSLAFDPLSGETVLVGGFSTETFVSDGANWVGFPGSPAGIGGAALVFDGTSVLATSSGATYRWTGSAWQNLSAAAPNYTGFRMAYDAARGRVLGFGGLQSIFSTSAETWEWDGSTWSMLSPSASPTGRTGHAMAFHEPTQTIVMHGGATSVFPAVELSDETWLWDGQDWSLATGTSPGARRDHTLVGPDPVLLHGGSNVRDEPQSDVWTWNGTEWVNSTPSGTSAARTAHGATLVGSPNGSSMLVVSGYGGTSAPESQSLEVVRVSTTSAALSSAVVEVTDRSTGIVLDRNAATPGPLGNAAITLSAESGTPQRGGRSDLRISPAPDGYRVVGSNSAIGISMEATARAEIVIEYSAPTPVSGLFRVRCTRTAGSVETRTAFKVDFRGDGSFDFDSPVGASSLEAPILVGPTPLKIVLVAESEVDTRYGNTPMSLDFTFDFREGRDDGELVDAGASCGNRQLDAIVYSDAQRVNYSLRASNLPPTSYGCFFVIGFANPSLPLGPSGCTLSVDLSIPLLVPVHPVLGDSNLGFSINNAPGQFRVQVLHAVIGGDNVTRWYTSNVVEANIR